MINAALKFKNKKLNKSELAKLALTIEHTFNPLTGYQDIYGCVYNGFKKLDFNETGLTDIFYYNDTLFNCYDMYLIPTGVTRSSTHILSSLNIDKIHDLMQPFYKINNDLKQDNFLSVFDEINHAWEIKKQTSGNIINDEILSLENKLNYKVLAKRLIGAGAGGYFLIIVEQGKIVKNGIPIKLGNSFNVIEF